MVLRSGGLASGIDSNSLIKTLVQIEKAPIQKLAQKKSAYQSQISLIGKIKSSLSDLAAKAKALDTAKELLTMDGTSSDDKMFGASATGDAAAASYAVEVQQVGLAEKNRSDGFATSDTVKAGTLTISVKGGADQVVTIEDGDSLAEVAAKFNDTITGAKASIISDGTNSYLSVTADDTGHTIGGVASDALVITEAYTGGTGNNLNLTEIQAAQNAQLTIDGLAIESESNSVQTALTGVTINVKKVTTAAETLTIAPDNTAIEAKLQEFVDSYNKAIDLVLTETKVTANTNREATLSGDATIRNLRSILSNAVNYSVESLAGAKYDALASIGIKTEATGKLKLDSKELQKGLEANINNVSKLFTADDGVMNRLQDSVKSYTQIDGILANRTDGINKTIKNIDARVLMLELRVESFEASLVKQFTALELAVSSITEQGNFLAQALAPAG